MRHTEVNFAALRVQTSRSEVCLNHCACGSFAKTSRAQVHTLHTVYRLRTAAMRAIHALIAAQFRAGAALSTTAAEARFKAWARPRTDAVHAVACAPADSEARLTSELKSVNDSVDEASRVLKEAGRSLGSKPKPRAPARPAMLALNEFADWDSKGEHHRREWFSCVECLVVETRYVRLVPRAAEPSGSRFSRALWTAAVVSR